MTTPLQWTFSTPGARWSGGANELPAALEGAWRLSRHTETVVWVYDCTEGKPVKCAEVGVVWTEEADDGK